MGRSPYQPDLTISFQRIDNSFPVDGSPFELAIVHRDTRRTLCRSVGDEWSEADHLLEGESWILPPLGGLPCAMLAHVQKVRTLAHSTIRAPCSAVHVSTNQHDQHAASRTLVQAGHNRLRPLCYGSSRFEWTSQRSACSPASPPVLAALYGSGALVLSARIDTRDNRVPF